MPVLVSAEDLATHLDTTVNREPAEQILDMVEAVVLTEYGTDTPPVADRPRQILRQVTLSAATRVYTNPTGLLSETIGNYTYRNDGGGFDLTDAERDLIRSARGGQGGSGLVSVPLSRPEEAVAVDAVPGPWWAW